MHHPRSLSAARRLRVASALLLMHRLLIPVASALLLIALLAYDRHLLTYGLVAVSSSGMLIVAQRIAASHASCPLCRTPVLAPMKCMKHRQARSLLGSYQLRVALAIMFTEKFRCPYCNEPTGMEVREKPRSSSPPDTRTNDASLF